MNNLVFYKERKCVADFMKRLYDRQITTASGGNISMRLNDELFCITPSALDKGNLTPEVIAIVSLKDGKNMTDKIKLSIETEMHRKVLLERPDVNAVVHAHPIYASTFATAQPCSLSTRYSAEAFYFIGDVVNVPYRLMGTPDLANIVAEYMNDKSRNCILMEKHGALAVGKTMLNAFDRMELLERMAVMNIVSKQIPNSEELTDEQLEAIRNMR
ncbi:MAG: class II aldolase/adducin family protein [Sphaerochaetaceae bacterium]|nr:class II aldolase/adducin family protein [Sphaerochaetaceae bacterium]